MKSIIAGRWNAALMAAKRPWPDIPVYVEGSTGKAEIVGTMSCAEIFGELRGENDYCPIPEIKWIAARCRPRWTSASNGADGHRRAGARRTRRFRRSIGSGCRSTQARTTLDAPGGT